MILRNMTEFSGADDARILAADVPRPKVQYALAREYGVENWKAIGDHITGGDEFEERCERALKIFCTKGPTEDSTTSEYER